MYKGRNTITPHEQFVDEFDDRSSMIVVAILIHPLPQRMQYIALHRRFYRWLGKEEETHLEQVGRRFGVTGEAIRQIENNRIAPRLKIRYGMMQRGLFHQIIKDPRPLARTLEFIEAVIKEGAEQRLHLKIVPRVVHRDDPDISPPAACQALLDQGFPVPFVQTARSWKLVEEVHCGNRPLGAYDYQRLKQWGIITRKEWLIRRKVFEEERAQQGHHLKLVREGSTGESRAGVWTRPFFVVYLQIRNAHQTDA